MCIFQEDGTWYEWARKSAGKYWKMQISYLRKDERNGNFETTGADEKILRGVIVENKSVAIRPESQEGHGGHGRVNGGGDSN